MGACSRRTAAEIASRHDDLIARYKLVGVVKRDVSLGQPTLSRRHARQGVFAEHPIFFRNGRIVGQILSGNDLIGVDVLAEYVCLAFDLCLHG